MDLMLDFFTTINEAKYKDMLCGLYLITQLKVINLHIFVDA